MNIRVLKDSQLESFDHDYVSDAAFAFICEQIERDFPEGRISFLDVGGGKGLFVDRLLARYPLASGTVLDNAELLLRQNLPHERKRLVPASVADMAGILPANSFDLVFFNLALHHFVMDSYANTRATQLLALTTSRQMLKPGGRVCVVENPYDGMLFHNLPGALVFILTSSRFLAPVVKRLGANTAGCGVCFLSTREWIQTFRRASLRTDRIKQEVVRGYSMAAKLRNGMLTIRRISRTSFWLQPQNP